MARGRSSEELSQESSPQARAEPASGAPERPRSAAHPATVLQGSLGNRAVVQLLRRGGSHDARPRDVVRTAAAGVRGAGAPLPHLEALQQSFGHHDLGHLRGYRDEGAARAAAAIGARAYAFGDRIAFADANPTVEVVAHEVAHSLQQAAGVQLAGGVGRAGDAYEAQAEAIGAAAGRGERVAELLAPPAPGGARRGVQRMNVDAQTAKDIKKRIKDRKGTAVEVNVDDRYYSFRRDKALIAAGVASMADDPKFEAEAERFEARIGSLAYNHAKSKAVCKTASGKVLKYIDEKYKDSQNSLQKIDAELSSFGIDQAGWSGAVGKSAAAIRSVLEKGSVSEQVAHVENFVCNVLNMDLMESKVPWGSIAMRAGLNTRELRKAHQRVKGTGDRYLAYGLPEGGASLSQWHTRANAQWVKKEGDLEDMANHPSSVTQRGLDNKNPTTTTRKKEQIEAPFPVGLGVKLGKEEARFQEEQTGSDQLLKWEEGARVWALNELDAWVHAQRVLSLPLVAGSSSTAARIMQAFAFLGAGPPDDVRLAAIGALLPPRHHSLVEVMAAAKGFGATGYREGPMMYHDLAPLTEQEVRGVAQFYPDETIDSVYDDDDLDDDEIAELEPLPEQQPQPQPQPQPWVDPDQQKLAQIRQGIALPGRAPEFRLTRATIKATYGLWNVRTERNSAQARMLRAVDAYHAASPKDTLARLRALAKVRDEAAHWLAKHAKDWFTKAKTYESFREIRDEAGAVVKHYEDRYMLDLSSDRMLADAHHAVQGVEQKDNAKTKALVTRYGLSEAECAALAVYVGPAYKFINPGLEKSADRMPGRLMGFVTETAVSFGENAKDNEGRAEKARQKLVAMQNKRQGAIDEAERHAIVATLALDKLPPYTGIVYAGGALTMKEARERFRKGEVQQRAAFASTTRSKFQAGLFAATKWTDVSDAYEADPEPDKKPFAYILAYVSRTGRSIEDFSHKPEEQEVLFAPNSRLRILTSPAEAKPESQGSKNHIIFAEEV